MANATAAGPSRGLLDVILGTNKDAEQADADGQGFMAMMNLIKTMNAEKEDQQAELGRTPRETTPGKEGGGFPLSLERPDSPPLLLASSRDRQR